MFFFCKTLHSGPGEVRGSSMHISSNETGFCFKGKTRSLGLSCVNVAWLSVGKKVI